MHTENIDLEHSAHGFGKSLNNNSYFPSFIYLYLMNDLIDFPSATSKMVLARKLNRCQQQNPIKIEMKRSEKKIGNTHKNCFMSN